VPRLVAVATAVIVLLLAPAGAAAKRTVPHGFFATDFDREVQYAGPQAQDAIWSAMAKNGVEAARVIFDWRDAQPTKGEAPTFARTDRVVVAAAAHGVHLLPIVMIAPRWARVEKDSEASRPSDLGAYSVYLKALVHRYGPDGAFWDANPLLPKLPVRTWQIWNEPDMAYQWQPRKNWQRNYGKLLGRAFSTIRKADPGALVVAAALTNYSWSSLDKLYRHADLAEHSDAVAINAYTRKVAHLLEIARRNREVMNAHGDRKTPLWITEWGASASKGKFVAPGQDHLQVTKSELARLVRRGYMKLAANRRELGVTRAFWYTWASSYDTADKSIFDFTGLARWSDFELHPQPALKAFRARARAYEGCKKSATGDCR
jgi:polysaccharide biosynthesis protein PslG